MHRDPHKADLGDDDLSINLESGILAFERVVGLCRIERKVGGQCGHVGVERAIDREQVLIRLVVVGVGLAEIAITVSFRSAFQAELLEERRDALQDATQTGRLWSVRYDSTTRTISIRHSRGEFVPGQEILPIIPRPSREIRFGRHQGRVLIDLHRSAEYQGPFAVWSSRVVRMSRPGRFMLLIHRAELTYLHAKRVTR